MVVKTFPNQYKHLKLAHYKLLLQPAFAKIYKRKGFRKEILMHPFNLYSGIQHVCFLNQDRFVLKSVLIENIQFEHFHILRCLKFFSI